jgi:hypothetical protein
MITAELEVCQCKARPADRYEFHPEMRNESVFLGRVGEVYVMYDHDVS